MSFWSNWDKMFEENRYLKVSVLALSALAVVQALANYSISSDKTTILIPANMTTSYEASGVKLSKGYFNDVGDSLSNLILTISPSNVEENFQKILPWIVEDPKTINGIRQILMEQAQTIKDNDIYQAFYPMKFDVYEKQKRFVVRGILRRTNASTVTSSTTATITFDFVVNANSKLRITKIGIEQ